MVSNECANSPAIPIAQRWLCSEEIDALRKDVKQRFGVPLSINVTLDPALESLLSEV